MNIIRYQPDVNSSVFNLFYDKGQLQKVELVKTDPIHEGMTADEAFAQTKTDCLAKTNLIIEINEAMEADNVAGAFEVAFDAERNLKVATDDTELKAYLSGKNYPIKE